MCLHDMQMEANLDKLRILECSVISPLKVLYFSTQSIDVRVGSLKILLHVLEVMPLLAGQVLFSFYFLMFVSSYDIIFTNSSRDMEKNFITAGLIYLNC